MDKEAIKRYANDLDAIANNEDDVEFLARQKSKWVIR